MERRSYKWHCVRSAFSVEVSLHLLMYLKYLEHLFSLVVFNFCSPQFSWLPKISNTFNTMPPTRESPNWQQRTKNVQVFTCKTTEQIGRHHLYKIPHLVPLENSGYLLFCRYSTCSAPNHLSKSCAALDSRA